MKNETENTTTTYNVSDQGTPRHDPSEIGGQQETNPTEHIPSWVRSVFQGEAPEFMEIAQKHLQFYPRANGDEGAIRQYFGRDKTYYYYLTNKGFFTLVGSDKHFETASDVTLELKFDKASSNSIRMFSSDRS